MAPLDQVDHFINTVYTDPRFRPPRPESTPVAPGGPSTPQGRESEGRDRQVVSQFSYNRCGPSHVYPIRYS